jgi:hypothetical protein
MLYNKQDKVRRDLIIQLLNEMELDGETMQEILQEVGMEEQMEQQLSSWMLRTVNDSQRIILSLINRLGLIRGELDYIEQASEQNVMNVLVSYEDETTIGTILGNIEELCDLNNTNVDNWEKRKVTH